VFGMEGALPCGIGPVMPDVRPRSQNKVGSDNLAQQVGERKRCKDVIVCIRGNALTQNYVAKYLARSNNRMQRSARRELHSDGELARAPADTER
jgi:hypothetical protein